MYRRLQRSSTPRLTRHTSHTASSGEEEVEADTGHMGGASAAEAEAEVVGPLKLGLCLRSNTSMTSMTPVSRPYSMCPWDEGEVDMVAVGTVVVKAEARVGLSSKM